MSRVWALTATQTFSIDPSDQGVEFIQVKSCDQFKETNVQNARGVLRSGVDSSAESSPMSIPMTFSNTPDFGLWTLSHSANSPNAKSYALWPFTDPEAKRFARCKEYGLQGRPATNRSALFGITQHLPLLRHSKQVRPEVWDSMLS